MAVASGSAEATATFGLVLLILLGVRKQSPSLPAAIAVYIVGAYWFTASTSFANPAVAIARSLSNIFAGIAPADAPVLLPLRSQAPCSRRYWLGCWTNDAKTARRFDDNDRLLHITTA
jgi:hypothetical protein